MTAKIIIIMLLSLGCMLNPYALEDETIPLQTITINIHDQESLQRGAKFFMNYCSGCHALKYMRYNQIAKDLGLMTFEGEVDQELLFNNLVFTTAKLYDPINIAMPEVDAKQWFGILPPDLSLIARVRGPSWLYTFLTSFYADPSQPFGSNNWLFPGVAMPNILAPLAGHVIAVRAASPVNAPITHLLRIKEGEMSGPEFNSAIEDLVNFLVYVGEPSQLVRYRLGYAMMIFLSVFLIIVYLLKRTYWRKISY